MSFRDRRKKQLNIKSLGDMMRNGEVKDTSSTAISVDVTKFILGPEYLDNFVRKWSFGDLIGILAGAGVGKCLAKGTEVLMYDGSIKKVEDIKVGDQLMGPDSTPRTVQSLARGQEEMFTVTHTDGTNYTVNRSHILSLKFTASTPRYGFKKGDILDISVDEYLTKSDKFKSHFKAYRTGVEFPEKKTNFDPYMMGVFLGDGAKLDGKICNQDVEILDYVYNYMGEKLHYKVNDVSSENRCTTLSITKPNGENEYLNEIRKFVTEDNQKTIPDNYKINSEKNRLELLAGIIDTDGYLVNNCYEVVIKDDQFAKDFEYLVRSVGLHVSHRLKESTIKSTGFKGVYHRFFVSGDVDKIPCKVERRKAQPRKQIKNSLHYGFTLESQGEGNYYGFEIDGDRRFLLGDFVVTHNTTVILNILYWILKNNEDKENSFVTFVSLELSAQEVADKWLQICGEDQHLVDRFFIVENYDEDDKCRELSATKIKAELNNIKEALGGQMLAFVIDHLHEVENNGSTDYNPVVKDFKNTAVELQSVGFILSQTTKGKGVGDIPIPKDGCYGCSKFEWLCSYIISVSQPLLRVASHCGMSVVALQYSKVRYKNKGDEMKEMMNYLFDYDFDTQRIAPLSAGLKREFGIWYEQVQELRDAEEKKNSYQYDVSVKVKGANGDVKLPHIINKKEESDEQYVKRTTAKTFRK